MMDIAVHSTPVLRGLAPEVGGPEVAHVEVALISTPELVKVTIGAEVAPRIFNPAEGPARHGQSEKDQSDGLLIIIIKHACDGRNE
jgi:hypothetical protein